MRVSHLALILAAGCMTPFAAAQTAEKPSTEQKVRVYSDKPSEEGQPDEGKSKPTEDRQPDSYKPGSKEYKAWIETDKAPYWVVPHRMMKGAWLGVSTSSPAPALRRQLKLPEGTALVVDFVQPKSPAEQIGLRQYDLLLKLDDQLLINNEQLAVLVRLHKPGSEVELTVLREGERRTLSGKLAEHEVPELPGGPEGPGWQGGQFEFQPIDPNVKLDLDARIKSDKPLILANPKPLYEANPTAVEHSFTWLDGAKQITIKTSNDHKRLIILDRPSGKIMFEGSIDSLEQAAGLPDEARDALKRLKQFLKTQPDASEGANKPADKAPDEPKDPAEKAE